MLYSQIKTNNFALFIDLTFGLRYFRPALGILEGDAFFPLLRLMKASQALNDVAKRSKKTANKFAFSLAYSYLCGEDLRLWWNW